jgi:hypothetical protein
MQEQDSLRHELLAQVASVAPILAERARVRETWALRRLSPGVLFGIHACLASFVPANWVGTKPPDRVRSDRGAGADRRFSKLGGW